MGACRAKVEAPCKANRGSEVGKELRVGFGGGSLESLWIAAPVSRAVEEEFGARGKVEKSLRGRSTERKQRGEARAEGSRDTLRG